MKTYGGVKVQLHTFDLGTKRREWSASSSVTLPLGKEPPPPLNMRLVGPYNCMLAEEK
jgi:hypothetical protein